MSGELDRLQLTSGGASYDEWNYPFVPYEAFGELFFPPPNQEQHVQAEWQLWTPPPVKNMAQVVLRTDWIAFIGDPIGIATFVLTIETFDETDPMGTYNTAAMQFDADIRPPFGPDGFLVTFVDIDITGFYTVPDDVTHTTFDLERIPHEDPELEVNGSIRFGNGRTLTPAEIAVAPAILPWVAL